MNSAKTSAESLRSTITTKYNDTTKKTSDVLVKMSEMETVLVELEDSLSELSQKKSTITTELASVSTKLSEISVSLSQSISLGNEVISILSGIRVSDAKSIVSPVATQIIPIKNDSQGINFMFPALLVLIIMFISLLLSSLSIVMEKNSRAYFRNFVTPTGDGVFLIASFLTNVFIQILQLVMVLVVTYFVFDKSILGNIITTVLILLMAVSFFVVLGMIVGYMFSSEEAAILGTISISSVLFFLSNIVMPLDALPESIKFFVDLNPFIIVMSLLRRSLLFNITYIEMYENLLFFGAYLVGAFVILFIMHKFMKLKFFYHNTLKNKKIESTANIPHGMKNQVVSSDNLKK
jgi:ABC-type multidrug transport system permease subunit